MIGLGPFLDSVLAQRWRQVTSCMAGFVWNIHVFLIDDA